MQVELWLVGKTKNSWVNPAMDDYLKRIQRYCNLKVVVIAESKYKAEEAILRDESKRLRTQLDKSPRAFTILLDEVGKQYSSRGLAGILSRQQARGQSNFRFIIGGAYGVDHDLHVDVDLVLSLSLMTFPHQLVRIIMAEQLYRAFTILRGEGYHH